MKLSVQLYTVRDALAQDVRGTLEKLRAIGLEYVEFAGLYGKTAAEWKTMLDEIGLKTMGAHIGIGEIEGDFDGVVATAKTLGFTTVVVPWIGEDQYGAGWDVFAHKMEGIARKLKAVGLDLAYHNHAFEFVEKDGKIGLDTFYETASADLVKAELDLAWVQIGGGDPAAWITKMKGRVPIIHAKDFDPAKTPQWVPAGQGKVDWKAVFAAAKATGVEYAAIELDQSAGDPLEAVAASFAYLKQFAS